MAPAATSPLAAAAHPQPFPVTGGPAPPLAQQAANAAFAKDAVLAWYRGEFAAANAIIDALCDHLAVLEADYNCGGGDEYAAAFAAIARRRANWIPVLHMQKFFSVADVSSELRRVAESRRMMQQRSADDIDVKALVLKEYCEVVEEAEVVVEPEVVNEAECESTVSIAEITEEEQQQHPGDEQVDEANLPAHEEQEQESRDDPPVRTDSPDGGSSSMSDHSTTTKLTDNSYSGGSADSTLSSDNTGGYPQHTITLRICSDHDACVARLEAVRVCKRFVAKESVKGHMVNVVKGLKLYEEVFLGPELSALSGYIEQLRCAGRRGELTGETFIFFNKQLKGNKREVLQLGVPVFQSASEEAAAQIDPIPPVLQDVIDHLVEWRLVPEGRKPNSCVINFFEEDEHSQPYFKPPHLDNPISTLLLEDTTMAFGRSLVSSHNGNYRGSLTLPLKQGSLLVMRGNSADMARHVVCPSSNTRVCITFIRVRPAMPPLSSSPTAAAQQQNHQQQLQHPNTIMTLWKPQSPAPAPIPLPYGAIPTAWGFAGLAPPPPPPPPPPPTLLMLAPPPVDPRRGAAHPGAGTGVFLPWTVGAGSKKYVKHLPPRIQRRRLLSLPGNMEIQTADKPAQVPCIVV